MSRPSPAGSCARVRTRRRSIPEAAGRTGVGVVYVGWMCRLSGGFSVVVVQQSAETLASFHFSALAYEFWIRADELVFEALMVAFAVVMHGELRRCATNRAFAKQDQPFQARLLNRAHKTLRVRVQIRTSCRQFH